MIDFGFCCETAKNQLPEPQVSDNMIFENRMWLQSDRTRMMQYGPSTGRLTNMVTLDRGKILACTRVYLPCKQEMLFFICWSRWMQAD